MKALVFAAGLGTRLRPLTDSCPKALVDVAGTPALGRVLRKLGECGVTDVVVNVHHFADMVERYLSDFKPDGMNVNISDERACLLDTGGGLLAARRWLDSTDNEPILIHNSDIMTDFPIREMEHAHKASGAEATLLTSARESSRGLLYDAGGRMRGWINNRTGEVRPGDVDPLQLTCRAFGGVHIVSPSMFDPLAEYASCHGRVFSITPFYIDYCRKLEIRQYEPEGEYRWFDIGRPDTLRKAQEWLKCEK